MLSERFRTLKKRVVYLCWTIGILSVMSFVIAHPGALACGAADCSDKPKQIKLENSPFFFDEFVLDYRSFQIKDVAGDDITIECDSDNRNWLIHKYDKNTSKRETLATIAYPSAVKLADDEEDKSKTDTLMNLDTNTLSDFQDLPQHYGGDESAREPRGGIIIKDAKNQKGLRVTCYRDRMLVHYFGPEQKTMEFGYSERGFSRCIIMSVGATYDMAGSSQDPLHFAGCKGVSESHHNKTRSQ